MTTSKLANSLHIWLSLLVLMSGLEAATEDDLKPKVAAADPEADERLRERWTAFVAEVNKELTFDLNASSPRLVSVVQNRDLYLTCAFTKPLRRHQVSFLRLKDFSLLFVGQERHTPEQRFSVVSTGQAWTLRLKRATLADSGLYECQVNTSPESISLIHKVTVLAGRTRILPDDKAQINVNVGGQLSLHCVIETGPVKPQFILWYKADKLVEYSSNTAVVSISTNGTDSVSHLMINNVSVADSGDYRCGSDLTPEASVQVYVVEEDFKSLYLGSHDKTSSVVSSSGSVSSAASSEVSSKEDNSIASGMSSSSYSSSSSSPLQFMWLVFLLCQL